MTFGKKPEVRKQPILAEDYSFSEVVDEACEKLMDRQIKYSIRRLADMEERLSCLERELDAFLVQGSAKLVPKDRDLG